MTTEEFYNQIGGSWEEILKRIPLPSKVSKFVNMFLKDTNYSELKAAMEAENTEEAFKAAHNLKGVSGNLALVELTSAASDITEALRAGDMSKAKEIMPTVIEKYEIVERLAKEIE
ncbi:MAG: Hpt domain-containing protein [Eubacterium sp.]|nr:Hpt domain-containing protein [Eubacterium sp.]